MYSSRQYTGIFLFLWVFIVSARLGAAERIPVKMGQLRDY